MKFNLLPAAVDQKMVIENLMQLYRYDFSEYTGDDIQNNGLFTPYPGLQGYWDNSNNKFPYIIQQDEKYIGFVLVKVVSSNNQDCFSIAEFFILKKYRRKGIGKAVAFRVFDLHKGPWEVFQMEANKPAQIFWNKVIAAYTGGQFKERVENRKKIQNFRN